ncbi:unnamed protein product [Heterobilharzia americana]|nr:unnamed protein product [Heterobilharzia americana]
MTARFNSKEGRSQLYNATHLKILQSKRKRRNSTDNFNQHWTRHRLSWRYQNSNGWGDMNAKLGGENTGRELTMGQEALGEVMNENGELFAEFCAFNDLVIGGSMFKHKDIHKATWISPDTRWTH